ncbi:MAG: thiamine pyrophosphate-binding protein [Dehalococcoidia bacterium]
MTEAKPVATGVDSDAIIAEVDKLGVTHVICVPDTFQKILIVKWAEMDRPKLVRVCTEDEGVGINAGLYMGGAKPMMCIQNNGIFASINTLKAISLDAKVPTFMLVGQFQRDAMKKIEENKSRAVRMLEPTLEAWGIPYWRIEGPDDIGALKLAYERAQQDLGPSVAIIGAPTT